MIIVIAISGALFYIFSSLDSLVETAIEKYGSEATHTAVNVKGVNILLQEGGGAINGITVANPDGFSDPHVFTLGEINVRIDVNSLTKGIMVIDEIRIHGPEIFYEINQQGKSNLHILKQNLVGDDAKQPEPEITDKSGDQETRLVIRRFILDSGKVKATIMPMDGEVKQASLSRLELTNIGGKDGATSREISKQLVNHIIEHALQAVAQQGIEKYLGEDGKKGLASGALDDLKKQLGTGETNLGDNIKGMFGK